MKIVILDGRAENPGDLSWSGFEELGDLTVYDRTPHDPAEIRRRICFTARSLCRFDVCHAVESRHFALCNRPIGIAEPGKGSFG